MDDAPRYRLKPLSPGAVESALEKAVRYRLLNEPWEAESICLDILEAEPGNQKALVVLLLARTDQLGSHESAVRGAREALARLEGEYEREYYAGIIAEREAKGLLRRDRPGTGARVFDLLERAMRHYETAATVRPAGDDSALLRWNTCARIITMHAHVRPAPPERTLELLE